MTYEAVYSLPDSPRTRRKPLTATCATRLRMLLEALGCKVYTIEPVGCVAEGPCFCHTQTASADRRLN